MRSARFALTLLLVLGTFAPSAAFAKSFCVQLDTGTFAGSQLVLKNIKLGKRSVGLVQGYLARYFTGSVSFTPIYGSSIVNASGSLALGAELPNAYIFGTSGVGFGSTDPSTLTLSCSPGSNGKLDVLDFCSGFAPAPSVVTGHVIQCSDAASIP